MIATYDELLRDYVKEDVSEHAGQKSNHQKADQDTLLYRGERIRSDRLNATQLISKFIILGPSIIMLVIDVSESIMLFLVQLV